MALSRLVPVVLALAATMLAMQKMIPEPSAATLLVRQGGLGLLSPVQRRAAALQQLCSCDDRLQLPCPPADVNVVLPCGLDAGVELPEPPDVSMPAMELPCAPQIEEPCVPVVTAARQQALALSQGRGRRLYSRRTGWAPVQEVI